MSGNTEELKQILELSVRAKSYLAQGLSSDDVIELLQKQDTLLTNLIATESDQDQADKITPGISYDLRDIEAVESNIERSILNIQKVTCFLEGLLGIIELVDVLPSKVELLHDIEKTYLSQIRKVMQKVQNR